MLKILTHLRTSYPPNAKSGADVMAERINSFLAAKGHEIITVIEDCPHDYRYKGVLVTNNKRLLGEKYDWCDIVITHLVNKTEATSIAKRFNKPIFHVVHNGNSTTVAPGTPDNYLIYNSLHLQKICSHGLPSVVINPHTLVEDWQNDIDHYYQPYITLVNCVANKGHDILVQLAIHMPNSSFLGVYGGYGQQGRKVVRNLAYKPFQANMKEIYNQTKIIIVPSISESWSLVAAEAQASGIPVICSDLPGLKENLGDTAIYAATTENYINAFRRLVDKDYYDHLARAGKQRQIENEAIVLQQLENLNTFMEKVNIEKKGIEEIVSDKKEMAPDISEKVSVETFEETEKVEYPASPEPEKKIIRKPGRPPKIKP